MKCHIVGILLQLKTPANMVLLNSSRPPYCNRCINYCILPFFFSMLNKLQVQLLPSNISYTLLNDIFQDIEEEEEVIENDSEYETEEEEEVLDGDELFFEGTF